MFRAISTEILIGLTVLPGAGCRGQGRLGERSAMSLAKLYFGSVATSAIEYASVTEQVALRVARLEGAGTPEKAYTMATEVFREELGKVGVSGQVAILREERHDEKGQARPLKTRPGILSVGDV